MALFQHIKNLKRISSAVKIRAFSAQPSAVEVQYRNAMPFDQIPGPRNILQIARLFALSGGKFYDKPMNELYQLMRKEYGDIFYLPGMFGQKPIVMTFSPEDAEKVFRAEGRYPYRRPFDSFVHYRRNYRQDIFETSGGLAVEQGHEWYDFRTKVNQIMMQPKNTKMYIPRIDEVAVDFIEKMRTIRDEKNEMPENFFDILNEWTLESVAEMALDTRLGLFKGHNPEAQRLYELVKTVFTVTYELDIQPSIWRYYQTPAFTRALKAFDEVTDIIYRHVERAVENYKTNPTDGEGGVLEKLLKFDKNVAIIMAMDMFFAGIESTSSSVVAILYCLATSPDKQEILRQEIFKTLPSKDIKMDVKSLDHVPYLRAVVKESIRMHPIFSGNARAADHDLVLQGYQVPKGTDILLINNSHNEYFEQAHKFIPERWLKDNTDQKCPNVRNVHPFAYLPFGFGSRICIGKRMANMEIEIIVARILREFKVEWNYPPIKYKSVSLNYPTSPLKFKLTDI